jgi:hypothetical protein
VGTAAGSDVYYHMEDIEEGDEEYNSPFVT